MSDKITQIIPAPAGLLAHYSNYENGKDGYAPVVCLALIEYEDNGHIESEVRAMTCGTKDDYIEAAHLDSNFLGLCFCPQGTPCEKVQ